MSNPFNSGDFLPLLLYANDKTPIRGKTRLQLAAFLFEKEILTQYKDENNAGL